MLSMFPLYIFLFIFDISIFLRNHNGHKALQLFCAISVARDLFIVNKFLYILYDDKINLPIYLQKLITSAALGHNNKNLTWVLRQKQMYFFGFFGCFKPNSNFKNFSRATCFSWVRYLDH